MKKLLVEVVSKLIRELVEFFNSTLSPDKLLVISKKLLLAVPLSLLAKGFFFGVFTEITIVIIAYVVFMWLIDLVTGLIYNVWYLGKSFKKERIYKSFIEFGLLIVFVIVFATFKYVMIKFEELTGSLVVSVIDGGITGLWMTITLLIGLVLTHDFLERGEKMNMPVAPVLMKLIRALINKLSKTDNNGSTDSATDQL